MFVGSSAMLFSHASGAHGGPAQQALDQSTIGIVVALVLQELDTRLDRLFDVVTDRSGGRVHVVAG